jgi:hypothetical protein
MVKARDNETCQYCGRCDPDGEVDHVLPLSRGGFDALENLVCACRECNGQKGNKTPREWLKQLTGHSRYNFVLPHVNEPLMTEPIHEIPDWVRARLSPEGKAFALEGDTVDREGFIHLSGGEQWLCDDSYSENANASEEIVYSLKDGSIMKFINM